MLADKTRPGGHLLGRYRATFSTRNESNTYHSRSADLHDLPSASPQGGFAADHVGAVAEHGHADEWVAVGVPVDDGLIILVRATRDSFIGLAVGSFCQGLLHRRDLLLGVGGDVDVRNLKIHGRHQVNTRNLGYDRQNCRAAPCIVYEGGIPGFVNVSTRFPASVQVDGSVRSSYSLRGKASELAVGQVAGVLAVVPHGLAEDFRSHLLDGFFGEEREWV